MTGGSNAPSELDILKAHINAAVEHIHNLEARLTGHAKDHTDMAKVLADILPADLLAKYTDANFGPTLAQPNPSATGTGGAPMPSWVAPPSQ